MRAPTTAMLSRAGRLAALLLPALAWANTGVPMLIVAWPGAWVAFVPITALEAWVARRVLGLDTGTAVALSLKANLVSTAVGLPLTWLALVLIELGLLAVGGPLLDVQWARPLVFPFLAAWLPPMPDEAPWMVFAATLVLCVPFYFASYWVEFRVARRLLPDADPAALRRWSRVANLRSYLLLAAVLVATIVYFRFFYAQGPSGGASPG